LKTSKKQIQIDEVTIQFLNAQLQKGQQAYHDAVQRNEQLQTSLSKELEEKLKELEGLEEEAKMRNGDTEPLTHLQADKQVLARELKQLRKQFEQLKQDEAKYQQEFTKYRTLLDDLAKL